MKWIMAALRAVLFVAGAYASGDCFSTHDWFPGVLMWAFSAFCAFMTWMYAELGEVSR